MDFEHRHNGVTIGLVPGEKFILSRHMLKGVSKFDTKWMPPFPFGSPFFRMFYGSYFAMREVEAQDCRIRVQGTYARGNFFVLKMEVGKHYCVSGHCLAGFSGDVKALHTHIKFQLPYWLLLRHFFPVFEGPGAILLYSKSDFEETEAMEFDSERVVAFDISRSFLPVPPSPKGVLSKIYNLMWSREVIWHFEDAGTTVAEMHTHADSEGRDESFVWRWTKHILGFLKF
jgi:hypothetical protein